MTPTYYIRPNDIAKAAAGNSFADVQINLATPVRFLALGALPAGGHLYLHFNPLNKDNPGAVIPVTGKEQWIPLAEFRVLRFSQPISTFFLSGDPGSASNVPNFSLLCSDAIDNVWLEATPTAVTPVNVQQWGGVAVSPALADAPTGAEFAPVVRDIARKAQYIETTTPLGAGAIFTGPWHDTELTGEHFVMVTSVSNVALAATVGLLLVESEDQVNTRNIANSGANTTLRISGRIRARYWRVQVQAAGAQTSLSVIATGSTHPMFTGGSTLGGSPGSAETQPVTTTSSNGVQADNVQSNSTLQSSLATTNDPLVTSDTGWGGAFSGTTDAARRGWSKRRMATIFKTVAFSGAGNTAIYTPPAGNKWRLLGFVIRLSANSTTAAAGVLNVSLNDNGVAMGIQFDIFLPATGAAVAGAVYDTGWIPLGDFGILAAAVATPINVNLSAALSAGNGRIIAAFVEE